MTNEIKGSGDGKEFDRELDALSCAYRDSGHDEPPAALDDAVRAAARRAVNARPQSLRKSWYSRFSGPLAIAAVMVLTVSITMVSVIEQPELVPPPVQKALAPRAAAPSVQEDKRAAEPRPAQALEKRRSDAAGTSQGRIASDSMRQAAPASPPNPKIKQAPETPAAAAAGAIAVGSEPARFVADPGTRNEAKREAFAQPAPAKDLADLPATQVAPRTVAAMPAPAAAPPVAPAMESPAAAKSMMAAPAARASLNAPAEAEQSRTDAIAAQPLAFSRKKQDSANVQEMAGKPAGTLAESPAQWLKRIVELRKEGKTKEAEEELARFRKRYPDYRLPVELKSDR
jgi:hypothetical protein